MILAAISFFARPVYPRPRDPQIYDVPLELQGWKANTLRIDRIFMVSLRFDQIFYREYRRGKSRDRVWALVGVNERRARQKSGLSPKTRLPGAGWQVIELEPHEVDFSASSVERIVLRHDLKQRIAYHWRRGSKPLLWEILRWHTGVDALPGRGAGLILTVQLNTNVDFRGQPEAQRRLDEFAKIFADALEAAQPKSESRETK